jgi:hypothetical protein
MGRTGSVHPDTYEVADDQVTAGVGGRGFDLVHEDLSAFQSPYNLPSRTQPVFSGQKPVESQTRRRGVDVPPPIARHATMLNPKLSAFSFQRSAFSSLPPVRVMRAALVPDRIDPR